MKCANCDWDVKLSDQGHWVHDTVHETVFCDPNNVDRSTIAQPRPSTEAQAPNCQP